MTRFLTVLGVLPFIIIMAGSLGHPHDDAFYIYQIGLLLYTFIIVGFIFGLQWYSIVEDKLTKKILIPVIGSVIPPGVSLYIFLSFTFLHIKDKSFVPSVLKQDLFYIWSFLFIYLFVILIAEIVFDLIKSQRIRRARVYGTLSLAVVIFANIFLVFHI